jgi:L-asparaginase
MTNNLFKIGVLTTGGTIEKSYDETSGLFDNHDNFLPEVLKSRLRMPYATLRFQTLMNKDSLHMTEDDRSLIFAALVDWSSKVDGLVVLHGTDTMDMTAKYCVEQKKLHPFTKDIPVVFTGSMRPFGFEQSDAMQNMTEALLAVKILSPGIYLSFHNQIFSAPHFKKNKDKKTFEFI